MTGATDELLRIDGLMDIVWENATALYFLWLVVPVAWLFVHANRRRIRAALRFADQSMVLRLMPVLTGSRPWVRSALLVAALVCFGVALARPRWGVYFETISQRGADVMVLLDVSRSMLARDVTPNRLERAKSDIRDLLRQFHGERVGLIAFAGKPVVVCPLTTDQGFFRFILDQVGPGSAPRGGTAIGDAIREALRAMEERRDRDQAILLITDGEDHDSFPKEAAASASERNVKIFAVGLGDPAEGERVPVEGDGGTASYMKYKGEVVWSKMEERLLQEIALTTGGAYVPAKTQVYDLGEVYEKHLASLESGEISAEKRKRYRERFQIFLGLGLVLLLAEAVVGPYRRRTITLGLCLALLGFAGEVRASDEARNAVASGIELYEAQQYDAALRAFTEADVARPESKTIRFDRAVVLHAQGDLDGAETLYAEAAAAREPELAARAHYNLGNLAADRARALFGEKPEEATPEQREEGLGHLGRAVLSYRACLDVDPQHAEARHNLEVIRMWIKHMSAVWAERDRQKTRDELDLLGFLEMLMKAQKGLRDEVRVVSHDDDSPRRRQRTGELMRAQHELGDEIEPLKEKIRATLEQVAASRGSSLGAASGGTPGSTPAPPGGAQGSPLGPLGAPSSDELAQARAAFEGLADQARQAMRSAGDDIDAARFEGALGFQKQAYGALDQLWRTFAPFEKVLSGAIEGERAIVEATVPFAESEPDQRPDGSDLFGPLSEEQERVAALADLLPPKAAQMRPQLEGIGTAPPAQGESEEAKKAAEQQAQQLEGLRQVLDKARELAPKAAELARGAAGELAAARPEGALPKAEEALKLLEEIAKTLPKQEQPQQQQGQDQQQQQQQGSQDQQQQPQEMSREQAKAMLRKAEEREREAQERRRELMQALMPPSKVEKDW
ncbi:MAG: VWA domain-containing protein [Planctomycetota bacterium]